VREELDRLVDEMLTKGIRYEDAQREIEKRFISRALEKSNGRLGRAASLLGIHRNTLQKKLPASNHSGPRKKIGSPKNRLTR
jgi:DNA-binding NtrC family response regulator